MIGIIVIVLVVVVVYSVTKQKKTNATTHASPAASSSISADKALATSINLQQIDFPSGWIQVPGSSGSVTVTANSGKATETAAVTAFAACTGAPASIIGQVFGNTPSSDEIVSSVSPVFQSQANSQIQFQSAVNIVKTAADAKSDAQVFNDPKFTQCFQQFQTASASALAPGTTAVVQPVRVAAPTGGVAHGFLTTFTIPKQGTRIVGDAYIVGGRIEATLQPSTHGVQIPSGVFNPVYSAMLGRIFANSGK
ncbi:MAG: hypothetical protein ACYCV7_05155 [Acidimicrobiales bacterium]